MASVWTPTLISVVGISAISLIGALGMSARIDVVRRGMLILISFAAGALLGDAFLHLIPQMSESGGLSIRTSYLLLAGVLAFFVLEKVLHWHHAHVPSEEVIHPVAITNLIGDGLHNLIDGAIVAGAFLVSSKVGVATAIAVALHEIPQELGDFGILVHAGLKPKKALLLNVMTSLFAVVGAVGALLLSEVVAGIDQILIPITAGGFVYIASTDLLPELHREPEAGKSIVQLLGLLAGIGVMALLLQLEV